MTNDTLGLPLEYQVMPEYFDAHNVGEDTQAKNAVLAGVLQGYGVKTVLDFTCGTGSQVFYLAERGYEVVGSDFSPELLEIAREKARAGKVDVTFLDGDMRHLQAGQFDAVISMFNAIGHLRSEDFAQAIRNVSRNLNEGGLYVFDIFNLEALSDRVVKDFAMDVTQVVDDTEIHHVQTSTLDRGTGRLTSHDRYTIRHREDAVQTLENRFTLQLYTAAGLDGVLGQNGFDVVERVSMDGSPFVAEETVSMLTVAQKR